MARGKRYQPEQSHTPISWETLDTKERRNLDMLTGTTRTTRSLLLMLFGISCHVAASSIPDRLPCREGSQARRHA